MTAPTERPGGIDANARGIAVLVIAVLVGALLLWKAGDSGNSDQVSTVATVTSTTLDTSGLDPNETTTLPDESTLPDETTLPGTTTLPGETTVPETPGSTTTTVDQKPADISVVVLNGGGAVNAAGTASTKIGETGYDMLAPKNATDTPNVKTTAVYYAEGFKDQATVVAGILSKEPSIVQPMPDPVPGPSAETADVAVVLGKDA